MSALDERKVFCPYCGEPIEVLVDHQELGQEYIEDCQVCCRPIVFTIFEDAMGDISINVRDENEAY